MRRNTREMRKEGEKRRGSEEWKTEKEGMEVNTEVEKRKEMKRERKK